MMCSSETALPPSKQQALRHHRRASYFALRRGDSSLSTYMSLRASALKWRGNPFLFLRIARAPRCGAHISSFSPSSQSEEMP